MNYRIVHKTNYKYKYPVSVGNHVACLIPRSFSSHHLAWNEMSIHPLPATRTERIDYFGNRLCFFTVQEPHKELVVESCSEVSVDGNARPWPSDSMLWEDVVRALPGDQSEAGFDAYQYVFESSRIRKRAEFAEYALESFTFRRPLTEALLDLNSRIHRDFRFDSKVTNVRTPTEEVFKKRRGVCQDFAHLLIACLRSLDLAARYVSGYLRTYPPPGRERLIGADASHAWVSVYCPGTGWLDLDPTNDVIPSNGHVTVAWGRDYGDVSPLRGLILGGGAHTLKVAVDMQPLDP
jgi:transglutaminase-like putative cysteine protease